MALGLAVSGGGDSMAMLHLAVEAGLELRAVTVDHGLRPEAAAEAEFVGRACAGLGVPHSILRWKWDGRGNLQDAARRGRRRLIGDWARGQGVAAVALAHTQDDVAETFLMRLGRGAGLDGLSEMVSHWAEGGVIWVRPLLGVSRVELREHLCGIGAVWVEDPSNDDPRFDRVKARKALAVLAPLGLTVERLAGVAGHLAAARDALEAQVDRVAAQVLRADRGAVRIAVDALAAQPAEVQRRLILRVLRWVVPGGYGPRGAALTALILRVLAGQSATLAGCRFAGAKGGTVAFRELKAVQALVAAPGELWDSRWQVAGAPEAAEVRALAGGIAFCPRWRETGLPRAALMAGPSVWIGGRLIAAPLPGLDADVSFNPLPAATALHQSAFLH